jgi:RNA polymerase sigma-70 factor (ECF subfamily)
LAVSDQSNTDDAQNVLRLTYFEKRANLIRFFAARGASPEAAEDLVQELYLKIAGHQEPEAVRAPVALLYRIAVNLMLDAARSVQRTQRRETAWRGETRVSVGGDEVSPEPPADETMISRERLRRLVEAAAELPPQMGRAFRLHKLEGLSHAQTAQTMGVSVKAVEKHISAALKALTAKLRA